MLSLYRTHCGLVVLALIAMTAPGLLRAQESISAEPSWPEITREAKPWTRWWWHGSAVTESGLTQALESYARAGLGGVEITPIYGVAGHESTAIPFLTPAWTDRLSHSLREAERLDMGVDIATGTGWPFGGPWVSDDDAPKYVTHRSYRLRAGERLREPIVYLQEPLVRAVGSQIYETYGIYRLADERVEGSRERPPAIAGRRAIEISELREPISANPNLQALALDQVRFPKPLPLVTLIAYSDAGAALELTERVNATGELDWVAPAGNWTVYAVFQGWHGKQVERAAPGGEGHVIDHFSLGAITRYLDRFDQAFAGEDLGTLRGFFNDSYEVDDAAGQADWTPALFDDFIRLRGYDLRHHLPALFGGDSEERNTRVLSDYRETVSDLILETFTAEWRDWANRRGAIVRNQAHGSPANILDLYAASDIPETEGAELLRIKIATSAANVSGKRLAAAESATWLGEHFTSTLADVKQSLDRYLLGGVNHTVYHGTAYSPPDEEWPGWLFYAAVHFTPENSWWADLTALNEYVARTQSFLQQGTAENDVLLYYPIFDRYADRGRELLQHVDGIPRTEQSAFRTAAEEMLARGYAFDFISDRQLLGVETEEAMLRTGGSRYQTVVLPQSSFVPLRTFEKLVDLARAGGTIVFFGGLPSDVPGLAELEMRRAQFRELVGELGFAASDTTAVQEARIGAGRVLLGFDLDRLLSYARVRREPMSELGLQFVRRNTNGGTTYFIANSSEQAVDGWVPIQVSAPAVALFDPMSGRSGFAPLRETSEGAEIYLQLAPRESRIIQTRGDAAQGHFWSNARMVGELTELRGSWRVQFEEGGPALPRTVSTTELRSWTEFGGEDFERFSGTATYTTSFGRPTGGSGAVAWALDLGTVHESARVRLNGQDLGTLIGPSYRIEIDDPMLRDANLLEIQVTNLMANRIADLDRRGVFWKKFYNVNFPARLSENRNEHGLFDASKWSPRASGIIGPVTLTPLERF